MSITSIMDFINDSKEENVRLFFIIRSITTEKGKRVVYYKTHSVDIEDAIRKSLWDIVNETVQRSLEAKDKFEDYVVVADDNQTKFRYSHKEKLQAFVKVIDDELLTHTKIPKFEGWETIREKGDLWAYCIGLYDTSNSWIYGFSRITQRFNLDKKGSFTKLLASFGTNSSTLHIVQGTPYSLDKRIDTIYCNNEFYVYQKRYFEEITGLKEEYQEIAQAELNSMKERGLIQGIDELGQDIIDNSRYVSMLNQLQQNADYQNAPIMEILDKVKQTAKQLCITLNFTQDGIKVTSKKEFEAVLRIITDYYKQGTYSHAIYGTSAGKRVDPSSE